MNSLLFAIGKNGCPTDLKGASMPYLHLSTDITQIFDSDRTKFSEKDPYNSIKMAGLTYVKATLSILHLTCGVTVLWT